MGPNQVWSWDITRLLGPKKWSYFYLYVILDIYSRYVVGWMLADRENSVFASRLIQQSCLKHGAQPEVLTLHSDRWAPMTSQCTAQLLADLGVTRSLSRPQVSDDNPFSEAHFKTLKCHPSFPGRFEDPAQAKTFCRSFFRWYNPEHRHGGISMLTPEQVHFGRADEVIASRKAVLNKAWTTHPERFVSDQHVVHRCARHESRPSRAPVVRISYSILNAVNAWTAPTGSPPPSPEPPQPRGPSWRASWRTTNGRIDPG